MSLLVKRHKKFAHLFGPARSNDPLRSGQEAFLSNHPFVPCAPPAEAKDDLPLLISLMVSEQAACGSQPAISIANHIHTNWLDTRGLQILKMLLERHCPECPFQLSERLPMSLDPWLHINVHVTQSFSTGHSFFASPASSVWHLPVQKNDAASPGQMARVGQGRAMTRTA